MISAGGMETKFRIQRETEEERIEKMERKQRKDWKMIFNERERYSKEDGERDRTKDKAGKLMEIERWVGPWEKEEISRKRDEVGIERMRQRQKERKERDNKI